MTVPSMPANTHSSDQCAGQPCCVHNPSDHHMRDWPQVWRDDRYLMERTCPHGIGHPDPDHMAHVLKFPGAVGERESGVHGCDGCCTPDREPFGADDEFAETLTVLNEERAADLCKCSHHRHPDRCPSAACGCKSFRLRVVDATYTRAQEYQMDAYGDYDHRPEED